MSFSSLIPSALTSVPDTILNTRRSELLISHRLRLLERVFSAGAFAGSAPRVFANVPFANMRDDDTSVCSTGLSLRRSAPHTLAASAAEHEPGSKQLSAVFFPTYPPFHLFLFLLLRLCSSLTYTSVSLSLPLASICAAALLACTLCRSLWEVHVHRTPVRFRPASVPLTRQSRCRPAASVTLPARLLFPH